MVGQVLEHVYWVTAVSPSTQKSKGAGAVEEVGIWNSMIAIIVGSQVSVFSQDPWDRVGSEARTVLWPVVATVEKKTLSSPFLPYAKRTPPGGSVPDNWKQNPLTPCKVRLYGCCPPASFSSSPMPPYPVVVMVPDVHILPPVFGKLPVPGVIFEAVSL